MDRRDHQVQLQQKSGVPDTVQEVPKSRLQSPQTGAICFFSATSAGNYVSFNGIGSRELQLPIHSKHI